MIKKKVKRKKSKKLNKKKKINLSNRVFITVSALISSFLLLFFVFSFLKHSPEETSLVALDPQTDLVTQNGTRQESRDRRQERRETSNRTDEAMENRLESRNGDSWREIIGHGQTNVDNVQEERREMQEMIQLPQEITSVTAQSNQPQTVPANPAVTQSATTQNITTRQETVAAAAPPSRIRERIHVVNPDLPKICVIIDDFGGIGNTLFERFNSLDREIAFAILPGLRNSQSQMERAVAAGREVLIHMPMEPESSNEKLEPNTIRTSWDDFQIRNQIESWMFEFPLAVGVNNHQGSRATQDERVLNAIMQSLRQNDLFFIDSQTSNRSKIAQVAQSLGIKSINRDIFLDVPDSSISVANQKINEIKRKNNDNVIVVITHCHSDSKYRQLIHFINRLKEEGYQLIPPSMAVN